MKIPDMMGLDFETYATTDLIKHGLDRYVHCPDFTPLIAVLDQGDGYIQYFDFVKNYHYERERLFDSLSGKMIVAHNAGFEQNVLRAMGLYVPSSKFIDSAVLARAAGAAGKLEAAAPQLLGTDKIAAGFHLIKLFSIPGKYQEENFHGAFDPRIVLDHPTEWLNFMHYCRVDAQLSRLLAESILPGMSARELQYTAVTMDMNNVGWQVDMELVEEMQRRYLSNVAAAIEEFRLNCDAPDLNLGSHKQLTEWCAARGVKATSFDEQAVARMLKSLAKRMTPSLGYLKQADYAEVIQLLETKQVMGGSSLKKLQTLIDVTGVNGRLHDQYLHIGAGATFRTTGRGVQMQNLKRLNGEGDDVELLFTNGIEWDNTRLGSNLRQVFTAAVPDGRLVVGDFSSVESRGLAWQAGEQWKLDAYHLGQDLYKVQAAKIFGIPLEKVGKPERQIGKVGELACGYGAGPDAVKAFAEKMGVELTEGESAKLVKDWREANPDIVAYWARLDKALHGAVNGVSMAVAIQYGSVTVQPLPAPESLRLQTNDPNLVSLQIRMYLNGSTEPLLSRVIHGVHLKGRNILYWKPSERKTGDLWVDQFTDPKTKRRRAYSVYGGKLAGLLTQSLCREVFFSSLLEVNEWAKEWSNVEVVGQFHDEIVVDWRPDPHGVDLENVVARLTDYMSDTNLTDFPLAAEVKSDYRYTK